MSGPSTSDLGIPEAPEIPGATHIHSGKVRDLYRLDDGDKKIRITGCDERERGTGDAVSTVWKDRFLCFWFYTPRTGEGYGAFMVASSAQSSIARSRSLLSQHCSVRRTNSAPLALAQQAPEGAPVNQAATTLRDTLRNVEARNYHGDGISFQPNTRRKLDRTGSDAYQPRSDGHAAAAEFAQGGGNIQVMSGRYGPYIKYDKVNATLPKDVSPESVTLDQAVALVADKQAKGKPARKAPAKKARPKAKPAAKAPAKSKAKPKAKSAAKS